MAQVFGDLGRDICMSISLKGRAQLAEHVRRCDEHERRLVAGGGNGLMERLFAEFVLACLVAVAGLMRATVRSDALKATAWRVVAENMGAWIVEMPLVQELQRGRRFAARVPQELHFPAVNNQDQNAVWS